MLRENSLNVPKLLIMMCVTCFIPEIWTDGEGNHIEAIESCKGRGGLANSKLFRRVPGTWTMPSLDNRDFMTCDKLHDGILLDGESAWVAGYAEFGEKFYTLEGCVDADKWKRTRKQTVNHENNVFECGNVCNDNTQEQAVGLYQNTCVCFRNVNNDYKYCNTSNDNKLFAFKLFHLHSTQMRNFQCGMINHTNSDWTQSSAKCLNSLSVICNGRVVNTSDSYKRVSEKMFTWIDAAKFCENASEKMYSYVTNDLRNKANSSNMYWLGAFRSFRVHVNAQYGQNTKACLSVTRTGNSLTLQPDDCGNSQKYICADDIKEGYNNKTDGSGGKDGDNINDNQGSRTIESTEKGGQPGEESQSPDNNSNPNNTTETVIGMIASVVVVVSLIITGIICLRRRRANKEAHKPLMSESSTDTNVIKGTYTISNTFQHQASPRNEILEEHEYASPEDVTDTNTVSSTKSNNSKIRPDKPVRNTLRREQKFHETYENFKLISTENGKVNENTDDYQSNVDAMECKEEYDVLCHNKAAPLTKLEHAEIHVYDHTTVQNNEHECYDSTLPGRGNKHKYARNAEDYDTVNIMNNENVDKNKDALLNDAHNEEMSRFGVLKLDLTPEQEKEPVNIEGGR